MTRAEPADTGESDEASGRTSCENLVEFQIVSVSLSPATLQALGDAELSTFCTYSFYLFELHATPVVTGVSPKYDFTSRYAVSMDKHFLDYLDKSSVTVELHQAQDWKTIGSGEIRLQDLLGREGSVHGSIPLFGKPDLTHPTCTKCADVSSCCGVLTVRDTGVAVLRLSRILFETEDPHG